MCDSEILCACQPSLNFFSLLPPENIKANI